MAPTITPGSIAHVRQFFDPKTFDGIKGFQDEWNRLTDDDKTQIRAGLADGSLTY